MPGLTIRRVLAIVREFLDEIKKKDYFFDVVSVDYIDGEWEVECEVVNYPEDDTIGYLIRLDDATGEISYIARQEGDGDDGDDGDEDDEGEGEGEEDMGPAPAPFGGGGSSGGISSGGGGGGGGTGGWPQ